MKKKVLIIGSSKNIVNLSYLLFNKNTKLYFLNFRSVWKSNKIEKFDIIVVSGFHYKICYINLSKLKKYIKDYYIFLLYLKKNCRKLILITTFLDLKYSFCRVVYFYFILLKKNKLLKKRDIDIYNFKKIMPIKFFKNSFFKKILLLFNFENTVKISSNFSKYKVRKLNLIRFYFINLPRSRFIDRMLRLF